MADPYRPEPRPTGLNTPNNPYYRRDRNVRVAREEESMQAFLTSGGLAPIEPTALDLAVEAMLAGTKGFAVDPRDYATLWQDSAKTTPVTAAGQPVGAVRTKFGVAQYDFVQTTDAGRMTWDGGAGFDVTSAAKGLHLGTNGIFRNIPAAHVMCRAYLTSLATSPDFFQASGGSAGIFRLGLWCSATGVFTANATKKDADTPRGLNSAAGAIVAGVDAIYAARAVYTPDNRMTTYKNGTQVSTILMNGVAENTEDIDNVAFSIAASITQDGPPVGAFGRFVMVPFVPTAGQLTTLTDWLNETPLAPPASLRPIDPDPIVTPL